MSINISLPRNWKTTLGGLLAGAPQIAIAAGFVHTPQLDHWLALASAAGAILLGASAKDWNTHSTQSEVMSSTVPLQGTPAPTLQGTPPVTQAPKP